MGIWPSWSPGAGEIVFLTRPNSNAPPRLAVADVSTGSVREVLGFMDIMAAPEWSPRGDRILFSAETDNFNWAVFSLSTVWSE